MDTLSGLKTREIFQEDGTQLFSWPKRDYSYK